MKACRGFTLVEMLLVVGLIGVLMGAIIFSFTTLQRGAELDEGRTQLESLFRFARAYAANSGRQVQINFEENVGGGLSVPEGNLRVLWEPDPIGQPGVFETLTEAAQYVRTITDLVSIEDVRPGTGETTDSALSPSPDGGSTVTFPPANFYPDGSSDSTELILVSRGAEDERMMSVRLIGTTGAIRWRVIAKEDGGAESEQPKEAPKQLADQSK